MVHHTEAIARLLTDSHTIAVVGLSDKPERASHEVAQYLQEHGYRIVPVNPNLAGTEILGERCYASLTEAGAALSAAGVRIDIVDCFRKAEAIDPIADEAIAIGAGALWMQLDIVNEPAAAKARAAGLDVVMDHCLKIEHMRGAW
jgi:predicted CoA-binding protein